MADRVVDHDVVVERVLTEALDADPDTAEPSYTIPAISTRSLRDAGYFRGEDGVEVRIGEQVFVVTVESK